nr:immunoglobulin heavy chain junction region [Mus musculus]MBK4187158.1 immunoglobulin heavy chain junction region [Mus musculus]MBK4187159.1 immunoglobulin heavy chain junction region [Mus musculus]MBK4187160.1 immunoglobulin heavy chain junction region [Mus musculus]MBK4187161.1 immunoglobulin heavy chain junction region [Mus musculus]
CARGDGYLDYW